MSCSSNRKLNKKFPKLRIQFYYKKSQLYAISHKLQTIANHSLSPLSFEVSKNDSTTDSTKSDTNSDSDI